MIEIIIFFNVSFPIPTVAYTHKDPPPPPSSLPPLHPPLSSNSPVFPVPTSRYFGEECSQHGSFSHQLSASLHPQAVKQNLFRHLPDPPHLSDGEGCNKGEDGGAVGGEEVLTIRFVDVGTDLRKWKEGVSRGGSGVKGWGKGWEKGWGVGSGVRVRVGGMLQVQV